MSSLLYGCESWLNADFKSMEKLYHWAIKQLLGVRKTTCNDLCYLEMGYPPMKDLVIAKQRNFFVKMWSERSGMGDDPLTFAVNTIRNAGYRTSHYINALITNNVDDIEAAMTRLRNKVRESESSKRLFYKSVNPDLIVHDIYRGKHSINEFHRMSFTRFRLSAHSLAVETGRWSRQAGGPLPLEDRVCPCGEGIQTERHVIENCNKTQTIRSTYHITTVECLFADQFNHKALCEIIHEILSIYK